MASDSIVRFQPKGPAGELQRWDDIPASDLESGRPVQRGHYYINDTERGLSAGVWDCTAFTAKAGPYSVNEFMLILEGSVTIVEAGGRETTIRAGESFIIPKGLHCQWKQPGYLRKYFVIFDDASGLKPADPAALRVLRPDPKGALAKSAPPPADLLLSPAPVQHAHQWFADLTGQWSVGVWDTTAYHRKPIPFPRHELMHILEGSVTLTDGAGKAQRFTAGDSFFVPLGAVCDWKSEGYLRKIYCIFQPRIAAAKTEAAE
jgi:uncharacterized cupin superfamily protein